MIRVSADDFVRWRAEHDSCREARLEYGMTDGPVYRDEHDNEVVLLTLNVEDFDRARDWFGDERFAAAAVRAGAVQREVYFAAAKT